MWQALKRWLIRQSNVYPVRWYWPVVRIYGGPEGQESAQVYMTRFVPIPWTLPRIVWRGRVLFPGGQPYVHFFHRADVDRDPHDHPFAFYTMPLNTGYVEEVYEHGDVYSHLLPKPEAASGACFHEVTVPRGRWTYRPATHTHRVDRTLSGRWPLVTLVWRLPNARKWGFWCHGEPWPDTAPRHFVPWRDYVYDGQDANQPGHDVMCPGGQPRRDPNA